MIEDIKWVIRDGEKVLQVKSAVAFTEHGVRIADEPLWHDVRTEDEYDDALDS